MQPLVFEYDPEVIGSHLLHWFSFDRLSPEQGLALLVGVEPLDQCIYALKEFGENQQRDRDILGDGIQLINGETIGGIDLIGTWAQREQARIRLMPFLERFRVLMAYWNPADHPEKNSLAVYVEWARSKFINPRWAPVAEALGLIPKSGEPVPGSVLASPNPLEGDQTSEKPLTTNERNTLLVIIAALCDYSAIEHQARGATSQIVKLTEDLGAPVSDDTVRRALDKIPDAVRSRMK